jgi:UDP-N-acetylmuramoyl-L-alanyl-D-glutamate--2,6-diaminopimelate ligase
MMHAVLMANGHTTALSSTIHFVIGDSVKPNTFKMTLPGRGFIQKFLREAVDAGATHAVIEITSESALQYRHLFLSQNALIFTGLEKEHLESHGSMEKYLAAKMRIGTALVHSSKRPRIIVANADNPYGKDFLSLSVEQRIPFSVSDVQNLTLEPTSVTYAYKDTIFTVPHPGEFSVRNALAVTKLADMLGVPLQVCASGLASLKTISGRAERIEAGQPFLAVVDYAHTPDSLEALYKAYEGKRKICVLGNTGGGRDTWKRPEMGRIADKYCDEVILTDEDPYDEDPDDIVRAMAEGMKRTPDIQMNRREAIALALHKAHPGDVVLITGKGTDPYIMRAKGEKEVWSDAKVVKEELEKLMRVA